MKFLTIKRRTLCVILVSVILICSVVGVCYVVRATSSPKALYTIVIDAGHGGRDGGAVGVSTDVTESELNLKYALKLKDLCEDYGFKVVLTRKDMNGLYSAFATNKKRSEMEKRREIIQNANADLVVSIHMNSFNSSSRGAQVFYADGAESGMSLAQSVQNALHKQIEYAKVNASVGDYYILNCTDVPSILVECGFLSNAEEEKLLMDESYQGKFCYALLYGILNYFSFQNNAN